jgi:hypothetical protein
MREVSRVGTKFFEPFLIYERNQRLGPTVDDGSAGFVPVLHREIGGDFLVL